MNLNDTRDLKLITAFLTFNNLQLQAIDHKTLSTLPVDILCKTVDNWILQGLSKMQQSLELQDVLFKSSAIIILHEIFEGKIDARLLQDHCYKSSETKMFQVWTNITKDHTMYDDMLDNTEDIIIVGFKNHSDKFVGTLQRRTIDFKTTNMPIYEERCDKTADTHILQDHTIR